MPNTSKRRQRSQSAAIKQNNPLIWIGAGILIIIVIVGVLMARDSQAQTTSQPLEISVDQAYQKYNAGAYLLDVRTKAEWDEYHIPNSHWILLDELAQRTAELPRDQEIVVVCRSGNRSQSGRDILLSAGFTQVTSMNGGVNAWRAAGYPIETSWTKPTPKHENVL